LKFAKAIYDWLTTEKNTEQFKEAELRRLIKKCIPELSELYRPMEPLTPLLHTDTNKNNRSLTSVKLGTFYIIL